METFTTVGWILLTITMFIFIVKVIYNTVKSERKRKQFIPTIKKGDKVYTPTSGNSLSGDVFQVNENEVKIIITVAKSRVYAND
jgi:preprotein translocase subunit YajC